MSETEAPNPDSWDDIADWWRSEISDDVVYRTDVFPVYDELTASMDGKVIDLGCGDGQGMARLAACSVGVDLSSRLLKHAVRHGPCVRTRLPELAAFRTGVFDHAVSIYLVDLIEDDRGFFAQAARVVRSGGTMAIVMNHPAYTAPGSAPIADSDGEVLWRWGAYQTRGSTSEPAGGRSVRFFHRPLGALLGDAAAAGWELRQLIERPLSAEAIEAMPGYAGQDTVPRLLGCLWERRAQEAS